MLKIVQVAEETTNIVFPFPIKIFIFLSGRFKIRGSPAAEAADPVCAGRRPLGRRVIKTINFED